MAAVLALTRASAPVASWSPTSDPGDGGFTQSHRALQPSARTNGRDLYVYNKDLEDEEIYEVNYPVILIADIENFITFKDTINTGAYSFTLTKPDGTVVTAKLMPQTIKYWYSTPLFGNLSFSMMKA